MADLLSGLAGPALAARPAPADPGPPPAEPLVLPGAPALAALARAFGHDHVLSYPRRNPTGEAITPKPPSVQWLRGYSETLGLQQGRRFLDALHRLDAEDRAAIAAELLREVAA